MTVIQTTIPEVVIIESKVLKDHRGFFFESFNQNQFKKTVGLNRSFVQENHSGSTKNVLRGLHYQIQQPQGKLIRVIKGKVFDVAVDLRKKSPHFGKWIGVTLTEEKRESLWIPEGFAHGFLVISDYAELLYLATDFYQPESERTILWNDPDLSIEWPLKEEPLLSQKDKKGVSFKDAEVYT